MNDNKYHALTARHGLNILLVFCISVIWFMTIPILGTQDSRAAEPEQTMSDEDFNRRVREYLINNPEVIAEAMDRLETREKKARQQAVKTVLKERAGELLQDPNSPVGGNAKGNVTLVEFFDYNCSYCRRVAPTMTKLMAGDPQLRVVYKEFPILGPDSLFAAKAALAAQLQDKYVPFHEAIMNRKGKVDEKFTLAAAAKTGLDVVRLKKDMKAPEIADAIEKNFKLAQALGINGTPGFVIGDQIFPGAVGLVALKAAVEQARGKKRGK
jgi:protein-disulfide isomerase